MLDRLENELKTRGFSQKTIESYLLYNQQFLNFTKKEPEKIEEQDIKNYNSVVIWCKRFSALFTSASLK